MADRGELPAGYRRCKYLEATKGTPYIDTLILPTSNMIMDITVSSSKFGVSSNAIAIAGSRYSTSGPSFSLVYWLNPSTSKNEVRFDCGNYINSGTSTAITKNNIYNFRFGNGTGNYQDGVLVSTSSGEVESGFNIYVFSINEQNKLVNWSDNNGLRIYRFNIMRNGEIIMNLIPALDPSGVPCMYDTVTKQPYYNQGTDKFGYELMDGTYVAPV